MVAVKTCFERVRASRPAQCHFVPGRVSSVIAHHPSLSRAMSSPPSSFGEVSRRAVSGAAPVDCASWCPRMDLLALATRDGNIQIQRLNGQKIIQVQVKDVPVLRAALSSSSSSSPLVTCLCWRSDGAGLAFGLKGGLAGLISIETKTIVQGWKHSKHTITHIRWTQIDQSRSEVDIKKRYLQATQTPHARLPLPTTDGATNTNGDEARQYFPPLTPIDTITETWCALSGIPPLSSSSGGPGIGARRPAAAASTHASASISNANLTEPIRGVLHDAFEGPLSVLIVGDEVGCVKLRLAGTLDLLTVPIPFSPSSSSSSSSDPVSDSHSILALDLSPSSCLLSVVTRCSSHPPHPPRVTLRTTFLRPILLETIWLTHLTRQMQQIQYVQEYIAKAMETMSTKWKAARRSFYNKVVGLSELIDELNNEESGTGVPESERSTPCEELFDLLLTGIPSFTVQQFITRFLSGDSCQKTIDLVCDTLTELEGHVQMAILPALRQIVWRLEEMVARRDATRIGTQVTIDEVDQSSTDLIRVRLIESLSIASSTLIVASDLSHALPGFRHGYLSFGSWLIGQVRLVNNEHVGIDVPGPDATEEERDGQLIPDYGPWELETIEQFLDQNEIEQDRVQQVLGEWNQKGPVITNQIEPSNDSSAESNITSPLPAPLARLMPPTGSALSLTASIARLQGALSSLLESVTETYSNPLTQHETVHENIDLIEAYQLQPVNKEASPATDDESAVKCGGIPPLSNLIGMFPTVSLTHAGGNSEHDHRLAWLTHDEVNSRSYVMIVAYMAIDASTNSVASPSHIRVRGILIPDRPTSTTNLDDIVSSQCTQVEWYAPNQLAIVVAYTRQDGVGESKLWLVEIESPTTTPDEWFDVDLDTLAAAGVSLSSSLPSLLLDAGVGLMSLISPSPSSDVDESSSASSASLTLPLISSRSRLFDRTLIGRVVFNSKRSLAAIMIGGQTTNMDQQEEEEEEEEHKSNQPERYLMQQSYKPTRRIILLDMDEDDEVDEDEVGDGEDGAEAEADGGNEDGLLGTSAMMDTSIAGDNVNTSIPLGSPSSSTSMRMEEEDDTDILGSIDTSYQSHRSNRSSMGGGVRTPSSKRSSFGGNASLNASRMSMILMSIMTILCMFSFLPSPCEGSYGDMDQRFRRCTTICSSRCNLLQQHLQHGYDSQGQPYDPTSDPFDVLNEQELTSSWPSSTFETDEQQASPRRLTWFEKKVMRWTCQQDCAYACMHINVAQRQRNGEMIVKYFGKWPFQRIFGTQELFSTIFSILNAIPHLYWLFKLRRLFKDYEYSMKILWTTYSCIYLNTWLWSTIFHARDFMITERLDYFGASLGISFSLCLAIIRIWKIETWFERCMKVFLPIGTLLLIHIGYLQFIHFDYGWNMKVSLTIGVIHSLLWLYNSYRHWQDGYHWRMVVLTFGLWSFASLEVFDFPPYYGLLDAHALWHGLTPVLGHMFYQWVVDDVNFQRKAEQEMTNKSY